ncbi:MAG TPA: outer membrane lipoprotein carrier protein LolA [Xanthobacteraceae bacterium]|nr:outer membrane lipoprotein carrier protein LolA [Xanthobacteraceae bacterium]
MKSPQPGSMHERMMKETSPSRVDSYGLVPPRVKILGALIAGLLLATSAAAQQPPPSAAPEATAPPPVAVPAKPVVKPKPKIAKPKTAPKAATAKPRTAPLTLTAPPPKPTPQPPADVTSAPTAPPPTAQPAAPLIAQPSPPRPGQPTLNAKQVMLVERISNSLSNLRTLVGEFKQVGADGSRTEGEFYLMKPGRVRFDYSAPSPVEIIADGKSVAVRDRNLANQDLYPISQTPLRFLLADHIDLLRDSNIVAVYGDDVFATVVIEERQIARGTYRVMLMFGAKDYQLKQWVVTDPQGQDTTVALYNLDPNTKPDPELFRIDYTRYAR